jgi:hypothetical protein
MCNSKLLNLLVHVSSGFFKRLMLSSGSHVVLTASVCSKCPLKSRSFAAVVQGSGFVWHFQSVG